MTSTKANDYGITTPTYFAFDDLGATGDPSGANAMESVPEVRVSVVDGMATVTCARAGFSVMAVGAAGAMTSAETSGDMVRIVLPTQGVNILRIKAGEGVRTVKLMNR